MSRDPARSREAMAVRMTVGGVQAGEFGGVQGAVQPAGPVGELAAVPGRQRGRDELAVAVVAGVAGFGGPDRVQDG